MRIKLFRHIRRNLSLRKSFCVYALMASACKGPSPDHPSQGAVPVNSYEVREEKAIYFDQYAGNIVALNEVRLMSEVSGYITGIFFKEGQQVRKGQKLYEIEPNKYAATYAQAVANFRIAKANLEKASKDNERYTALEKLDAIARQRVEYARTDFKNAKQQVSYSKAEMEKAKTDLEHSIIPAPFDGTIGISQVKMGALTNAGQTLLNTISSNNPMAVDFVISEKEIGRFQALKKVKSEDNLFRIGLPDKTIYKYGGQIEFFDRAVDPLTGTLRIRLQFPNPDFVLKTGMSCDVRVLNNSGRNAVLIPSKAVMEQMGEFFIYVIEKDTARQHKITLGQTVNDKVIVSSGLSPGEKIVIEGIQKLHDGTPVETRRSPVKYPNVHGK